MEPICNLSVSAINLPVGGGSPAIFWQSMNAVDSTLWIGDQRYEDVPLDGSRTFNVTADTIVRYDAWNEYGASTCIANIDVAEPAPDYYHFVGDGWGADFTDEVFFRQFGNDEVPDIYVEGSGLFRLDGTLFADIRLFDVVDLDANITGAAFDASLDEVSDTDATFGLIYGRLEAEFVEDTTISADQVTRYSEEESREVDTDIGTLYRGDVYETFGGVLDIQRLLDYLYLADDVSGKTVNVFDARGAEVEAHGLGNFVQVELAEDTFFDIGGVLQTVAARYGDGHFSDDGHSNTLIGGTGSDFFNLRGTGDVIVSGRQGNDVFRMVTARDEGAELRSLTLTGGSDADTFELVAQEAVTVTVTDYQRGSDDGTVAILDGQFELSFGSFVQYFATERTENSVTAELDGFTLTLVDGEPDGVVPQDSLDELIAAAVERQSDTNDTTLAIAALETEVQALQEQLLSAPDSFAMLTDGGVDVDPMGVLTDSGLLF